MATNLTRNDCEEYSLVDGTEDMLWDDSEEDGDVSSDSKEDEGRL
jgi:hypothetical protein